MSRKTELYCSFCGKSKDDVFMLIAGAGGVNICDECVAISADLVAEKRAGTPAAEVQPPDDLEAARG
jgi:ATP-dependent Clp protease ATP-binding subunit ClpX